MKNIVIGRVWTIITLSKSNQMIVWKYILGVIGIIVFLFSCGSHSTSSNRVIEIDGQRILEKEWEIIAMLRQKYDNSVHKSIQYQTNKQGEIIFLSFEETEFASIPLKVLTLGKLETLILYRAPIKNILGLSSLSNLRTLVISGSKLPTDLILPDCVKNLNVISIKHSNIRSIKFPVSDKIKAISLMGNNLSKLDSSLFNLTNLEELYLRVNKLKDINLDLNGMKKLRVVSLLGNPIEDTLAIKKRYPNVKYFQF